MASVKSVTSVNNDSVFTNVSDKSTSHLVVVTVDTTILPYALNDEKRHFHF